MKKLVSLLSLLFIALVSFSLQAESRTMSPRKAARIARHVLRNIEVRPGGVRLGDAGFPVGAGMELGADMQDIKQYLFSIVQRLFALEEEVRVLRSKQAR